jgi:ABC-2 type transport system permease protein
MRAFLTLFRREGLATLRSTFAWTMMAAFSAATGFLLLMALFSAEGSIETLQTLYARVLILLLPVFCALATMRSFPDERQSGTLEALLTAPVSDGEVVAAKFAAAFLLAFVGIGASLVGFVLYVETALPAPVYSRTGIAAALAVILLHAAAWTAMGTLAALLSRHQAVAAAACLLPAGAHSLLASGLAPGIDPSGYLNALSVVHVARGVLDSRPVLLCLSLTAFCLFAATRGLEARRWRL